MCVRARVRSLTEAADPAMVRLVFAAVKETILHNAQEHLRAP